MNHWKTHSLFCLFMLLVADPVSDVSTYTLLGAESQLTEIHEDFTDDPGWEGIHNWINCEQGPTKTQNFGWRAPQPSTQGMPGKIGGKIWNSTTPASYGMPIGPFDLKQPLSASGTITFRQVQDHSNSYLGFYNAKRQGWRPLSSMMFAFPNSKRGEKLRDDPTPGVQPWFTVITSSWLSTGAVTDLFIPANGTVHRWRFDYTPDSRIELTWPHPQLPKYFTLSSRLSMHEIMKIATEIEPLITRQRVRQRLDAATNQSLLVYDPRRGTDYWELVPEPGKHQGGVTLQIDDETPVRMYLPDGFIDQPMEMNRFGLVNTQSYGNSCELYVGDLVVNGYHVDLSKNPGWRGQGNRVTFEERDFHGRQQFGFVPSNWAGEAPGEIGGHFWRTEPIDPMHAFYADAIGRLTLDDPISFSGNICFVDGQPDSDFMIGYFNRDKRLAALQDESSLAWRDHFLGVYIGGPSRIGYYFMPLVQADQSMYRIREGYLFEPTRKRHRFHFTYDPTENNGNGVITVRIDNDTFSLEVGHDLRSQQCVFDRFGIMNVRTGGKFVQVYVDDLTYTVRRANDYQPQRHQRQVETVSYPEGGRRF